MHEIYENPLCKRYASREMQEIFSDDRKFSTWRKLWIALAESEKELGLDITDEQIAEMKAHIYDIDYEAAAAREKEVRHDGAHLRLRACLSDRKADHSPRRDQLLCRRQHRHHPAKRRPAPDPQIAAWRDLRTV